MDGVGDMKEGGLIKREIVCPTKRNVPMIIKKIPIQATRVMKYLRMLMEIYYYFQFLFTTKIEMYVCKREHSKYILSQSRLKRKRGMVRNLSKKANLFLFQAL